MMIWHRPLQTCGMGRKVLLKQYFTGIQAKKTETNGPTHLTAMHRFASTADSVAATTKKLEKVRLVAEYFRSVSADEAAQAAIFFSGRAFPAWEERTLQVGGTLLWRVVGEISGKGEIALTAAYRRHGDLGAAAEEVLQASAPAKSGLTIVEVAQVFDELARTSSAAYRLQ